MTCCNVVTESREDSGVDDDSELDDEDEDDRVMSGLDLEL